MCCAPAAWTEDDAAVRRRVAGKALRAPAGRGHRGRGGKARTGPAAGVRVCRCGRRRRHRPGGRYRTAGGQRGVYGDVRRGRQRGDEVRRGQTGGGRQNAAVLSPQVHRCWGSSLWRTWSRRTAPPPLPPCGRWAATWCCSPATTSARRTPLPGRWASAGSSPRCCPRIRPAWCRSCRPRARRWPWWATASTTPLRW